jgi:hypothetical protein
MTKRKHLFLSAILAVVVGAGFGFANPPAQAECIDQDTDDGCCSCDEPLIFNGDYADCVSFNCLCKSINYCN